MKRFVECSVCGDRIEEGERAFRIDGEWYCDICGVEYFRDVYEEEIDRCDCEEDEERREEQERYEADDAAYDRYRDREIDD